MSNRNEVIVIPSSSADATPEDVPITHEPAPEPKREKHRRLYRYNGVGVLMKRTPRKRVRRNRKIVINISSSSSSTEPEEDEDSTLQSNADSHRESKDAILERDPSPTTSASSNESRFGPIPDVASPPPRIHMGPKPEAPPARRGSKECARKRYITEATCS